MQEKSSLASEVINLRIIKVKSKSVQMHLDAITEDCVGTGLQSSEEQTSRNISLNKTPRLWYGVKPLKLLEADCLIQATGRFLLFISDLLICSLLFEYHIATPIATWQLSAWKFLLLLQATSFPEAERKQGGWLLSMNTTLWGYMVHVQKCSHVDFVQGCCKTLQLSWGHIGGLFMWHEVYYFVCARMLENIWPIVFLSSSGQVSVYVSKSGSVHMWKSSVFRKDWETTVGWRFFALFSHKIMCR